MEETASVKSGSKYRYKSAVTFEQVWLLTLLTGCYVVGELSHFLIGVTSRDVAREIHYGDQACFNNLTRTNESDVVCSQFRNESDCEADTECRWDYTGLGLEYQILAGPSFIAVFTVSGILMGIMGDWISRTKLLGISVILFSISTICMAMATSYWHLVLLRMLLAVGESACSPIGVSLISDFFTISQRGTATGIFHWGVYFGYGLSYAVGVYISQANLFGFGWRMCYFFAGIPGLFLGALLLCNRGTPRMSKYSHEMVVIARQNLSTEKTEEFLPFNTDLEKKKENKKINFGISLRKGICQPCIFLLLVAASLRHSAGFSFAYNARLYNLTYYPDFDVGAWLALVSIFGGCFGVVLGGLISDCIVRKIGVQARLWLLGTFMVMATPFAVGVLYLPPPESFISLIFYYIFSETWFAILFISLVELVPSSVKTSVLGIFLFLMNNLGGNSPVLVDPLSKLIGYRPTLYLFFPGLVLASGILFFVASIPAKKKPSSNYLQTD